jgi:iron complex outermembrane recepter protein
MRGISVRLPNLPRTLIAVAVAAQALPASAQLVLEEVIVTANKIESSLMETPTAVTSFDEDMRQLLGIDNSADLAVRTPSLTVAPSRVSIRGVGRANIALGSDPGVGLYWDGVYNTETDVFSYSNFLDIDRIEILRGPQGTLYGRNSIGGAINFVSRQPTDEWEGKLVGEVGNYESYVAQGLISGPVTEKLGVLVALSQIERKEGFQENIVTGEEYDKAESTYGTISLRHMTTDRWTNTVKVISRDGSTVDNNPYILEPYSTDLLPPVFNVDDPTEQLNFPGMFPGQNFANLNQGMTTANPAVNDEGDISIDRTPYVDNERDAITFISEFEGDSFILKYTAGYAEFDYASDRDADGIRAEDSRLDWSQYTFAGFPISDLTGHTITPSDLTRPFSQNSEFTSHELQITSDLDGDFNFIGGLYYYNSEEDQALAFIEHSQDLMDVYRFFAPFTNGGVAVVDDDGYLFRGEASVETDSYAAYGQMNWSATEATVITVGLRYTYDERDGTDNTFVQYVGPAGDPTIYREIKDDWDQVSWRLGVDHFLADDHFLYAFAATGYRSGGFNLMAPRTTTDVDTVDPEDLLSFEVGYKGQLLDGRVNLATALYYYDYEDLQVLRQDVISGVSVPIYENAADAQAWGLETEVIALLTEHLTFSAAWSYNESEYDEYDSIDKNACDIGPLREGLANDPLCTGTQDLSGNSFPLTPEHTLSANLTYAWELFDLDWSATASYMYNDEQYLEAFNVDEYDLLDDWDRWDARLAVASPEGVWEVTAYAKNIGDDREVRFRSRPDTTTNNMATSLTDPRILGLRVLYNF